MKHRPKLIFMWVAIAMVVAIYFALNFGSVDQLDFDLILQLRLPRIVLALAVGMGLAVSGVALQSVFSNPLCEPYTLGISSGASLGAVIGITLGLPWGVAGVAGTAFVGGIIFSLILLLVSFRARGGAVTLLLSGVMLAFLGSSLVALWMAMSDANGVQGAIFWLLGDLSRARLNSAMISLLLVVVFSFFIWLRWRELDALLLGQEGAKSMGVSVKRLHRSVIFLTAVITGICVSAAGMIGFVGLVIPHIARFFVGSLHFRLLPLSAFLGALALVLADGVSRWLARPYELPVGVVTALLGAPLFLWIMLRRQGARNG